MKVFFFNFVLLDLFFYYFFAFRVSENFRRSVCEFSLQTLSQFLWKPLLTLYVFLSLSLFLLFFFSVCVFWFVCECECECEREWVCLQWRLKQWESLWGRWTVFGLRIWWWDLGRLIFFFFFFFFVEVWGNLIQRFIMIRHVGVTGVVWLCVDEDRVVLCVCFLYWFG